MHLLKQLSQMVHIPTIQDHRKSKMVAPFLLFHRKIAICCGKEYQRYVEVLDQCYV